MSIRARRVLCLAVAVLLLATGCSTAVPGRPTAAASGSPDDDRSLVEAYYADLNAAAEEGTQDDFLRHTQHPDYADRLCDLGGLTLHVTPAMSTFRADPEWVPPEADRHPRGSVYVLGVSITVRQGGALLGEQIGSQRVVVLDGRAYGFAPCPTGG